MESAAGYVGRPDRSGTLPTGSVIFLFTDIEGSTQRWEQYGDAMKIALARHDVLLRSAIESRGGHVFKTVGDAFCAAFATASAAAGAALDTQRTLAKEDWSAVDGLCVRVGLHAGDADEREGDYFGPSVNRVARLMSSAHGGQIVLSAAVADLIRESLAPNESLIDLGTHRLKDLLQPEHVFQLTAADLRADFPQLRTLDARPNNLPVHLTNLVGRGQDVIDVSKLFANYRLVTLAGAGGVGKTRLATEVGAELLGNYSDGVWLVELAAMSEPEHIIGAVAGGLSVRLSPGTLPLDSLVDALRQKRILIILDNCEHVVAACAALAVGILHGCPHVRILATSREPLHVEGEYVYRVPSLAVPNSVEGLTAEEASRFSAVALFAERAATVGTGFALSDANAPVVAQICRRLDGIPLAIELAASRVRVLNPASIAQKLDDRFRLLEGGRRAVMPRQQTLRALIDWSHDLLTERERALFRRLSIFSGTFSMDAVAAICTDDTVCDGDILNLVSSLVDKSLTVIEQMPEEQCFRMLESIREFARDRLSDAGENDIFARRHAAFYCDAAQSVQDEYRRREEAAVVLRRLDAGLDNYRAAIDWAFGKHGDAELGTIIATSLSPYWENRGLEPEGLSRLEMGLSRLAGHEPTIAQGRAYAAIASLAFPTRQLRRTLDAARSAAKIARALGDEGLLGRALRAEGDSLSQFGSHDEAARRLDEALPLLRSAGLDRAADGCLLDQGMNENARGHFEAARRIYEELRLKFRSKGDVVRLCHVTINLAETEFASANVRAAISLLEEIVPILEVAPHFALAVRCNLASYLLAAGEIERGKDVARSALEFCVERGYFEFAVVPLESLALVAAIAGDASAAARIVGFTDAIVKAGGAPREQTEQRSYDRLMTLIQNKLPQEELAQCVAAGVAMSQEAAIKAALAI
jgi:predicted ATPase/class 3 adenylate cyclase